jgi:hypothetical protein
MPDPKLLEVGDRVRFVSLPEEWKDPGCSVQEEDKEFMKLMVKRTWPSRVCEIDEYGHPWIAARIRVHDQYELHTWAIIETMGWKKVQTRF